MWAETKWTVALCTELEQHILSLFSNSAVEVHVKSFRACVVSSGI